MKLILKSTVDNLGEEGDVVKVKPGFGRNYLIPQRLAVLASKQSLSQLELEKDAIEARRKANRSAAEALADKLAGITISLKRRVGEEGKLYGSVNSSDIADELAEIGITLDKRKIIISEPIKTLGSTVVPVKIGFQVTGKIKVEILAEEA